MGKSGYHGKLGSGPILFLSLFLITISSAFASPGEFELFDRGYEEYLSYRPEKAADTFRSFLKAFPESSAGDAALFWLGKSLQQMKSLAEAEKAFENIRSLYPESAFIPFAERELEKMKKETGRDDSRGESKKDSMGEGNRLRALLDEEKKRADALLARLVACEEKEAGLRSLIAVLEKERDASALEKERKNTGDSRKRTAGFEGRDSLVSVAERMGIKELPWRTGDPEEDRTVEELLLDEARRASIVPDRGKLSELKERYGLDKDDAGLLERFLMISGLIERRLKEMPEEKAVETLHIRYSEKDRLEKAALATELQKYAKGGKSFEEIQRIYPGIVTYSRIGFEELKGLMKERAPLFHGGDIREGEIVVVWSESGYIMFRPWIRRISYSPFEEGKQEIKDELKRLIKGWVAGPGKRGKEAIQKEKQQAEKEQERIH